LGNNFCPFIKDACRSDCVFKHQIGTLSNNSDSCHFLDAYKLSKTNDKEHEDLVSILKTVEETNKRIGELSFVISSGNNSIRSAIVNHR
jgi:hypothetical protein